MTKTIELSKRLAECADWLSVISKEGRIGDEKLRQWAEDLRSLIIPPPGERDETEKR